MRLYPEDSLEKFEFTRICQLVRGRCYSDQGRRFADEMSFSADYDYILTSLRETAEFRNIMFFNVPFPDEEAPEITEELNQLKIANSVLTEKQFLKIRKLASLFGTCTLFLKKHETEYPALFEVLRHTTHEKGIGKCIDKVIDENGDLRPDASPELRKIRKAMDVRSQEQNKVFRKIMNKYRDLGILTDSFESIRNGRRVLSVQAEHKRRMTGIIHDESDTGKTSFIEPQETVLINNELFELQRAEQREIFRILRALTAEISGYMHLLAKYQILLGKLDFTRAKARFAVEIDAVMPKLEMNPQILLYRAFHPLLLLINNKSGKKTIPLDVELNYLNQILVISGPNAGGKSVCLKTIGLLQMMVQSGMLIPVDENSTMGIFNNIFTDLGDSQSLDDELSTYSSRLVRMKYFLENSDNKTLFLIDEFGSGTDPDLGGAVAEAILDSLRERHAYGVITTHYSNMKIYATQTRAVMNGRMTFDERNLQPMYSLEIGKPGSSYTFDIARKIDLPENVIDKAVKLADRDSLEFEALLRKAAIDQEQMQKREEDIRKMEKEMSSKQKQYEDARQKLKEREQKTRLLELREKDESIIKLQVQLNQLQAALKTRKQELSSRQETDLVREISKEIEEKRQTLRKDTVQIKKSMSEPATLKTIAPGAKVKLMEGEQIGIVQELRKNKALVAFNNVMTTVKIADLLLVDSATRVSSPFRGKREPVLPEHKPLNNELDLRGKSVEEGLSELEQFMDSALVSDLPMLRIIHGKGSGILRNAVRKSLRSYKMIESMEFEAPRQGGDGVTVVRF